MLEREREGVRERIIVSDNNWSDVYQFLVWKEHHPFSSIFLLLNVVLLLFLGEKTLPPIFRELE